MSQATEEAPTDAQSGQGLGTAMVELLHEHARASGVAAVEINVDEGDVDAQRFYERHGYAPGDPDTGERAFYYLQEFTSPR